MTLFQSIIQGILSSFSEFFPIGEGAHQKILEFWLDWPAPSPGLIAAVAISTALATFLYSWADWASMTSSLLQVVLLRRRPKTLDEKLPLYILAGSLPAALAWIYGRPLLPESLLSSEATGIGLIAGALLYSFLDGYSRKNRQIYDWNLMDSLLAGACQAAWILPGGGRIWGASIGAFLRNHSRESAAKYSLYLSLPALTLAAIDLSSGVTWGASTADAQGTSWLTFGVVAILSLLTSFLALNTFMKLARKEGLSGWIRYRALLGAVILATLGWRMWTHS